MKNNPIDDTFLARWLSGQLTEQELAEFESHEDFQTYKKIAETAADFQMPARNKDAGWEVLSQQMENKEVSERPAKVKRLNSWWKYAAAAAVILLIGYFGFFQDNGWETHSVLYADQKLILLPDGSKARLNADSEIRFNRKTYEDKRLLELKGEAFFEVLKGAQFTVETRNGEVRVLGTSFNVRSRKNKIEVTCYTGKVGLSFDQFQETEIINPGDRVIAKRQQIVQKDKIKLNASGPGWTSGQSRFIQANFLEVVEEVERQFNVELEYPLELENLPPYNGGFPHNDLETALNIVFSPVGYQYKITGAKVIVFK